MRPFDGLTDGGICRQGNYCPLGSSVMITCDAGKYCHEDMMSNYAETVLKDFTVKQNVKYLVLLIMQVCMEISTLLVVTV